MSAKAVAVKEKPQLVADVGQLAREVVVKVCATCSNWRPNASDPVFGQCAKSGRSMQAPLMTTDHTSCSAWSAPIGRVS